MALVHDVDLGPLLKLDVIRPGSLVGNAVIERVSGQLREACRNAQVLLSWLDARQKITGRPIDDDVQRPHGS